MAQLYGKKTSDGLPKALECTDDGQLKVDTELTATIDPAGLATEATLGIMQADITLMKSDIASISGIHLGNGGVITHNHTSQTITVPATAKSVRLATKGGATNFEINPVGDASADSPGYIPEEAIDYYPITGGSMTLKVYGTAGYCFYYFLG